jgi:hypothetical protein
MKMMVMQLEALMKQKSKQNKQQSMGKAGNFLLASSVLQFFWKFFCSLAPYCKRNFAARWRCIMIFLEILLLAGGV